MMRDSSQISRWPPQPVPRPLMLQSWNQITFIHWPYAPETIQQFLPSSLQVDAMDGRAWVGVTPFLLEGLTVPGVPPPPWISRSPETNVRTYVRAPDGRRGIWFFSLEIARLPAVAVGRAAFRLPYMWSKLAAERMGDGRMRYRGGRRWGGRSASYDIEAMPTAPIPEAEIGVFDNYLTARWMLFTLYGGRLASVSVEHEAWPLWRARLLRIEQDLLGAAGLPASREGPVLHFSPGVSARIDRPRLPAAR
jgi:uncharacterized protein YqjF (DUF2071 family)